MISAQLDWLVNLFVMRGMKIVVNWGEAAAGYFYSVCRYPQRTLPGLETLAGLNLILRE